MDGSRSLRAAFVYQNPRRVLAERVVRGEEPDSTLLGQNHLAAHGIDARIRDPLLTRRPLPGRLQWLAWNARELTLPWEVGRADVLFTPLGLLLPLAARTRPGLRTVVVDYGLNLIHRRSGGARRRVLRESLHSAAAVVCLGESQRRELVEWELVPEERTETLLAPVDERWFAPRPDGEPGPEPLVLTVGKDLARDFGVFAEAVRGLDARAELVVHPRNLAGVELPANARARSGLGARELRDLYAAAACVVVPQRPDSYPYGSEGGGLTALLEAMAMAKPLVVTERGILADYVRDGETALVVPPADPRALRAAVERVLGDPELAARLGVNARAAVEERHTTRRFAARLADLFRRVV